MSWERSFVVATLALGGSFDDAMESLAEGPRSRVAAAVAAVRDKPRADRARWMATALAEAAVEADRMALV
jgi:hypothetical protein